MQIKIRVVGAGVGSFGYENCLNKYPPSFLFEWGGEACEHHILFECPAGVHFRLDDMGIDFKSIKNIAISHPHPDHCALVHFYHACALYNIFDNDSSADNNLNVYCPLSVKQVSDISQYHAVFNPESVNCFLDFNLMSTLSAYQIGDAMLYSHHVYHEFGRCESLAYRLELPNLTFCYSGDTGDCSGIRTISEGADVFVCECSARVGGLKESKRYGHLTPFLAGDIANNSGVKYLYLIHYSGINSAKEIIADCLKSGYSGKLFLLEDGKTYYLEY